MTRSQITSASSYTSRHAQSHASILYTSGFASRASRTTASMRRHIHPRPRNRPSVVAAAAVTPLIRADNRARAFATVFLNHPRRILRFSQKSVFIKPRARHGPAQCDPTSCFVEATNQCFPPRRHNLRHGDGAGQIGARNRLRPQMFAQLALAPCDERVESVERGVSLPALRRRQRSCQRLTRRANCLASRIGIRIFLRIVVQSPRERQRRLPPRLDRYITSDRSCPSCAAALLSYCPSRNSRLRIRQQRFPRRLEPVEPDQKLSKSFAVVFVPMSPIVIPLANRFPTPVSIPRKIRGGSFSLSPPTIKFLPPPPPNPLSKPVRDPILRPTLPPLSITNVCLP